MRDHASIEGLSSDDCITIASWYKFVALDDCEGLKRKLLGLCRGAHLKGTVLLSREGINGTVAGQEPAVHSFLGLLTSMPEFEGLIYKEFQSASMPFHRMKVRLKKEIISLGTRLDSLTERGCPVEPKDWNALIEDPDVLVLDTRNRYESAIGTFERAHIPSLGSFREFAKFAREHLASSRHNKVAMFCTGGIRCEKASALLLELGFGEVFQLKGGILEYLREVPEENSRWVGECFVFDERVAVRHGCAPGSYEQCRACRYPVSASDRLAPEYEQGVSCPNCFSQRSDADRARYRERQRQVELAAKDERAHIGAKLTIGQGAGGTS